MMSMPAEAPPPQGYYAPADGGSGDGYGYEPQQGYGPPQASPQQGHEPQGYPPQQQYGQVPSPAGHPPQQQQMQSLQGPSPSITPRTMGASQRL